jgi:hypothetical protein
MKSAYMLRRLMIIFMALTLSLTSVACGSGDENRSTQGQNQSSPASVQKPSVSNNTTQTPIAEGKYPVQQATYNDADGEYTLMLLNTPAGTPPVYRSTKLQMARLTDEEIKAGEKTYFKSEKGQVSLQRTSKLNTSITSLKLKLTPKLGNEKMSSFVKNLVSGSHLQELSLDKLLDK